MMSIAAFSVSSASFIGKEYYISSFAKLPDGSGHDVFTAVVGEPERLRFTQRSPKPFL